jgi:Domain of unknown function (DUF1841)
MFSQDRHSYRQTFVDVWAKSQAGQPLTPLESRIAEILKLHPEYQDLLEDPEATMERDWLPEQGEANPFLHLGLHLALLEQLSVDRPGGIRKLHRNLVGATADLHEAEHLMMACLAEALWRLQHDAKPFDEKAYLKCIKRAGGGVRPRG